MQGQYCEKLDEEFYAVTLSEGFQLWMMPKKHSGQTVAKLTVGSGVLHQTEGKHGVGIAHLVEHLLFEKSQGDIAQRFADWGGDINASTGLENTEYALTCGGSIERHINLLCELVFDGWWTLPAIEREKEIVYSEIETYGDDPEWVGYYASLFNAFGNHPLAWEIAGDHQLLEAIDLSCLERWHKTFYRPSNAALFLSGDFEVELALDACQRALHQHAGWASGEGKEAPSLTGEYPPSADALASIVELELPVRTSQVFMAFPDRLIAPHRRDIKRELILELGLDIALGPASDAYLALYEGGLIGADSFTADVYMESTCGFLMISAETSDPRAFTDEVSNVLSQRLEPLGLQRDLGRAQNKMYGQLVRSFETPEGCIEMMSAARQLGASPFDYLEALESMTMAEIRDRWRDGVGALPAGVVHIHPVEK